MLQSGHEFLVATEPSSTPSPSVFLLNSGCSPARWAPFMMVTMLPRVSMSLSLSSLGIVIIGVDTTVLVILERGAGRGGLSLSSDLGSDHDCFSSSRSSWRTYGPGVMAPPLASSIHLP